MKYDNKIFASLEEVPTEIWKVNKTLYNRYIGAPPEKEGNFFVMIDSNKEKFKYYYKSMPTPPPATNYIASEADSETGLKATYEYTGGVDLFTLTDIDPYSSEVYRQQTETLNLSVREIQSLPDNLTVYTNKKYDEFKSLYKQNIREEGTFMVKYYAFNSTWSVFLVQSLKLVSPIGWFISESAKQKGVPGNPDKYYYIMYKYFLVESLGYFATETFDTAPNKDKLDKDVMIGNYFYKFNLDPYAIDFSDLGEQAAVAAKEIGEAAATAASAAADAAGNAALAAANKIEELSESIVNKFIGFIKKIFSDNAGFFMLIIGGIAITIIAGVVIAVEIL